MSNLDRILKLAGRVAETGAHSQAEREMKAEAVGDAAECFYKLQDDFAGGEASGAHKVLIDDLVRFLSVDQLEEFCDDFRRHYDMDSIDEAELDEDDLDENAFNQAAAAAARAGKSEFEFNGKTYKTKMDKETAHKLDDDVQFESEELEEAACGCCGETPCDCGPDCDCRTDESTEEISEAPTMDTTQLVILLKNAGLSEEAIEKKINEWANSAPDAAEQEQTSHGEPYENFAQSVNLSLKRYLDAEAQKVSVSEHTVEDMKALYESKKSSSK